MMRLGTRHRTSKNVDIAMATFLKIFIVVLLVVLLAHGFIGWLRPDVTPGLSFLPGDIKYESPGGNVQVYFPIVTSIVLSVVLTNAARSANGKPSRYRSKRPLFFGSCYGGTTLLCLGFACTWIENFFGPCRANPGHLLARSTPWKLLPCRPCSFWSPTRTDPLAPVQRP